METWKTIDEFPNYEVSDLGRVKRITGGQGTTAGKLLNPSPNDHGYLRVSLWKDNKALYRYVHRLVAKAFIPNPLNLPEVNHKHGKQDNLPAQLEWRSHQGHMQDVARRNQSGDGVHFDKSTGKWEAKYNPEPSKQKYLGQFNAFAAAKTVRDTAVSGMPYRAHKTGKSKSGVKVPARSSDVPAKR